MGRFKILLLPCALISILIPSQRLAAQTTAQDGMRTRIAEYVAKALASKKGSEEDKAVLEVIAECAEDFSADQSCKERISQLQLSRDFHSEASRSNQVIDDFIQFYGRICTD